MVNNPNEVCLSSSVSWSSISLSVTWIISDTGQPTAYIVAISAVDGKEKIMNQCLIHTKSLFHPARKNKGKSLEIF